MAKNEERICIDKSRIPISFIENNIIDQKIISEILFNLRYNYHHYLMFKLCILAGLKPQEIVNVRVGHLIDDDHSIFIPNDPYTYCGRERFIGLDHDFFLELFRFSFSSNSRDYLFQGRDGSMSWRSLSYMLSKIRTITGRYYVMKDFQNSFVISLMKNGCSLEEIAYFLGHKDSSDIRRKFRRIYKNTKKKIFVVNSIFLESA